MESLDVLMAKKLIRVLGLKRIKGFYQTTWGRKTEKGLIATILSIMTGKLTAKELME